MVKGAGESLITALQASNVLRSWFLDGGRRQPVAWEDDREVRRTASTNYIYTHKHKRGFIVWIHLGVGIVLSLLPFPRAGVV